MLRFRGIPRGDLRGRPVYGGAARKNDDAEGCEGLLARATRDIS